MLEVQKNADERVRARRENKMYSCPPDHNTQNAGHFDYFVLLAGNFFVAVGPCFLAIVM